MGKVSIISADYPVTIPLPHKVKNKLTENITLNYIDRKGVTQKFTIVKDRTSDGASIPKPFWVVIGDPFNPKFARAAWFHDYMAVKGANVPEISEIFYRLLLEDGVNRIKAEAMRYAVLAFVTVYLKFFK